MRTVQPSESYAKLDGDFLTLWRARMRSAVKRLKENRLASRLDTSDLVQEGMIQVWRNIGSFRGTTEQEFDVWIKRIASGHAANASRFHHAKKRDIAHEVINQNPLSQESSAPDEQAERAETLSRMAAAIEKLDPKAQFVVMQHSFESRTFADIATELACSAGTVRNLYCSALDDLRVMLDS